MAFLKRLTSEWAKIAGGRSQPTGVRATADERPDARVPEGKAQAEPSFPKFRLSAGDQIDPRLRDRLAETRRRLRDAFTPSQPVNDRHRFAGRVDLLTDLIRAIEDGRLHVVIYGQRGIGKTSVLHVLAQAAAEARYRVAYVSCGAGSSLDETFRAISRSMPLLFHADYGPTSAQGERGDTFADLLGSAPVTAREASDLMSKVAGTRLIVMLDEFDRVESAEFRLAIAEFIKNLSDRLVRVQLVIAGVAANLTELLTHTPSIQRTLFAVEAPPLSTAEIRQLVELGERAAGLQFEGEAVDAIASSASGLPYLTSLLSHHAAFAALEDGRVQVVRGDVVTALDRAVSEMASRLPEAIRRRGGTGTATALNGPAGHQTGLVGGNDALSDGRMEASGQRVDEEALANFAWLRAARARLERTVEASGLRAGDQAATG